MTAHRDIPGFYFDEVKGKYFRIQPNHNAPQGALYSRGAVNHEASVRKADSDRQRQSHKLTSGRVLRSSLRTPFFNLSIGRTMGYKSELDARSTYYAANLSPVPAVQFGKAANFRQDQEIVGFGLCKSQLYLATCHQRSILLKSFQMAPRRDSWVRTPREAPILEMMRQPAQMITIGDELFMISGRDGFMMVNSNFTARSGLVNMPPPRRSLDGRPPTLQIQVPISVQDIAASPDGTYLAFATNGGLLMCQYDGTQRQPFLTHDYVSRREQMTVTFLNNNVAMSGERSGALHFCDTRSNDHVHRLHHSSAINGITARNTNQVIVSGLQTVALYDLRYLKRKPKKVHNEDCFQCKSTRMNGRHTARKSCKHMVFTPTQPLVKYYVPEDRHSQYYTSAGKSIVYIANLDITAIASHRSGIHQTQSNGRVDAECADRVTLYQSATGRMLQSPLSEMLYRSQIRQLGVHQSDEPDSIFVCTRDAVDEWRVEGI